MSKKKKKLPPIVFIVIGIVAIIVGFKLLTFLKAPESKPQPIPLVPQNLIASVQDVPTGEIRVGGSTTAAGIRKVLDPVIQLAFPDFRLKYINPENDIPSTESGIKMLLDGKLDLVHASKAISEDLLEKSKQKGIKLKAIPIAISGFAIAVNPNLTVPGLTLDEYQNIVDRKILNWKEVGGPDLDITFYMTDKKYDGDANSIQVRSATEAFQKIKNDRGGLHIASAALAVPQCGIKTLPIGLDKTQLIAPYQEPLILAENCTVQNHNRVNIEVFRTRKYPLLRDLSIVIVEDAGLRQKAGTAYAQMVLTDQGQDLVRQAGYLSQR
jgi:phosphate transport system substrate-binding protein